MSEFLYFSHKSASKVLFYEHDLQRGGLVHNSLPLIKNQRKSREYRFCRVHSRAKRPRRFSRLLEAETGAALAVRRRGVNLEPSPPPSGSLANSRRVRHYYRPTFIPLFSPPPLTVLLIPIPFSPRHVSIESPLGP